mmetsp:Transcript_19935/g.59615  ORF Transcript_19935/g.59615 Transcript_19935/m.59615 type:complete len:205 (+) Transcript_19935:1615-2229(+)
MVLPDPPNPTPFDHAVFVGDCFFCLLAGLLCCDQSRVQLSECLEDAAKICHSSRMRRGCCRCCRCCRLGSFACARAPFALAGRQGVAPSNLGSGHLGVSRGPHHQQKVGARQYGATAFIGALHHGPGCQWSRLQPLLQTLDSGAMGTLFERHGATALVRSAANGTLDPLALADDRRAGGGGGGCCRCRAGRRVYHDIKTIICGG